MLQILGKELSDKFCPGKGDHNTKNRLTGIFGRSGDIPPPPPKILPAHFSWWTFRIFFIFSALGEGNVESEAAGGGVGPVFSWKSQGGGRGSPKKGGVGPGAARVSAASLGGWGAWAKYCFSGPKFPPSSCL